MVRMYYTCLYQKMVTIWYYFTYQSITTMKLWITYLLSHDIQVSSWNICLHFKLITDLYFKLKVMVCGSFLCCFVVILFNVITKKNVFQVSQKTFTCPKPTSIPASSFQSSITRLHHDDNTGSKMPDNKFYELRTYKIKPSSFPAFMKLTNENMAPRLTHSKLIGYWATDIGGLNEVFHIWEYGEILRGILLFNIASL